MRLVYKSVLEMIHEAVLESTRSGRPLVRVELTELQELHDLHKELSEQHAGRGEPFMPLAQFARSESVVQICGVDVTWPGSWAIL